MIKFSFRQQVLAGFAASIVLVLVVGILSYHSINKLKEDAALVSNSQKIIITSDVILQQLTDADGDVRGYVVTQNKIFLDSYHKISTGEIEAELKQLRNAVQDDAVQTKNVEAFAALANSEIRLLRNDLQFTAGKKLDSKAYDNIFLVSNSNIDSISVINDRITNTELKLLVTREASSHTSATAAIATIIVGSSVFLIIILLLFFYIQGTFAQQKRIEEEILQNNIRLEKALEEESKNWLLSGVTRLNETVQGEQSEKQLSEKIIKEVCTYTDAQTGTFYLHNDTENALDFMAGYAFHNHGAVKKRISMSEGWVGQAAEEGTVKVIKGKINSKLEIATSLLREEVIEVIIVPFFFNKKLKGVFEIGYQNGLSERSEAYLKVITDLVGIAINTAQSRTVMRDLFEETQQQAEELSAQQEEMRVTNEELVKKTEMLQASEEELRVQQEELRTSNVELEEKASLLEEKNQAIEEARRSIAEKMQQLETTGKYKSEFLANMSHELRTPLNSILVLARILKDNKPDNLTGDQIKYASVIFNAGNDLLTLINDILDLSKIESGKLEIVNETVKVADILKDMEMLFAEVAAGKKIKYTTHQDGNVPDYVLTDKLRIEQVIKNLLSNAFKFTPENGSVGITAEVDHAGKNLTITIKDTGIGIPLDKQKLIFEAFQQADGSTSRKYGGTGLGLSISRELANLLGGFIKLKSTPGEGSEFTLTIPVEGIVFNQTTNTEMPVLEDLSVAADEAAPFTLSAPLKINTTVNGRSEPLIVIVEDDKNFAFILQDYAKEHNYKSILVHDGDQAFPVIRENLPDAVILDIMLPGKDGWEILKQLKTHDETAAIPVHLMSAGDAAANKVRKSGAINFLKKPIDAEILNNLFKDLAVKSGGNFKYILLIEDHQMQSHALKELMEKQGITVDQAFDGASAFDMVQKNDYQCVILDLNLPDISGLDLLDKIKEIDRFVELPVIVNTAMELDKASLNRLMQYANAMVIKNSKSSERLIDEVNLFLNKINTMADHPYQGKGAAKIKSYAGDRQVLKSKKILIVDDDMRNIFALSSALQTYEMQVEIANDGEEALKKLSQIKDIDLVLMDIMMPVMDGYEAMRQIRKQVKYARLPVIALTAKAMKEDREKCIEAGANDYVTKPVDMDRLLALMQIWLEQ